MRLMSYISWLFLQGLVTKRIDEELYDLKRFNTTYNEFYNGWNQYYKNTTEDNA